MTNTCKRERLIIITNNNSQLRLPTLLEINFKSFSAFVVRRVTLNLKLFQNPRSCNFQFLFHLLIEITNVWLIRNY